MSHAAPTEDTMMLSSQAIHYDHTHNPACFTRSIPIANERRPEGSVLPSRLDDQSLRENVKTRGIDIGRVVHSACNIGPQNSKAD